MNLLAPSVPITTPGAIESKKMWPWQYAMQFIKVTKGRDAKIAVYPPLDPEL